MLQFEGGGKSSTLHIDGVVTENSKQSVNYLLVPSISTVIKAILRFILEQQSKFGNLYINNSLTDPCSKTLPVKAIKVHFVMVVMSRVDTSQSCGAGPSWRLTYIQAKGSQDYVLQSSF